MVVDRQAVDLLAEPRQVQLTAQGKEHLCHALGILPGCIGRFNDTEQCVGMSGACHHAGDGFRHSGLNIAIEARLPQLAHLALKELIKAFGQGLDTGRKVLHLALRQQLGSAVANKPAAGPTPQAHQLVHQLQLHLGGDLMIQRFDAGEVGLQMKHVPRDNPGAGDVADAGSGRLHQPAQEGNPHVVDQVVGQLGRHNLPVQAVAGQRLGMPF